MRYRRRISCRRTGMRRAIMRWCGSWVGGMRRPGRLRRRWRGGRTSFFAADRASLKNQSNFEPMTRQQLISAIRSMGSYLCVGLDTDPDKIPRHLRDQYDRKGADAVFEFNRQIIDATKGHC